MYEVENADGEYPLFEKEFSKLLSFLLILRDMVCMKTPILPRVSKTGKLYLNTTAKLNHHHDASGRPNQYQYGKNGGAYGWYVWRTKKSKPII
jgi:hypothetical protein